MDWQKYSRSWSWSWSSVLEKALELLRSWSGVVEKWRWSWSSVSEKSLELDWSWSGVLKNGVGVGVELEWQMPGVAHLWCEL